MHVIEIVDNKLGETAMHKNRRQVLLEASGSLLVGSTLSVTGIGRSLVNGNKVKHNINKINRLVGNVHLYDESRGIYQLLSRWSVGHKQRPIILVDWSSVTPGERYQVLRASVALEGRSLVVYEEVHPLQDYNSAQVHRAFLQTLAQTLAADCLPIIVTDAGFCVPWFKQVQALGWDFIGRISNTSCYLNAKGELHKIRDLFTYQRERVNRLGPIRLTKRHRFACYLHVYKKRNRARVHRTLNGERAARSVSVKAAQRERQPWIIVSSLGQTNTQAKQVVKAYGLRMQIEESFRDLKSPQFGLGLRNSRTQGVLRLTNLLIIAYLVTLLLWLIGLCAKQYNLQYDFQANSIKSHNVLSVIFLAKELIRQQQHYFYQQDWNQALLQLQGLVKCF